MAIRRTRTNLEDHYTQLDNEWLRDGRLSLKARGLFAQILSHREGWSISIASLERANPEGSSAIRSALNELIEFGYLVRGERERDEAGRLGDYDYTLWGGKGLPDPDVESPTLDNPTVDNQTPKKNISKKTISKNIPIVPSADEPEHFDPDQPTPLQRLIEEVWSLYPVKRRSTHKVVSQKITALINSAKAAERGPLAEEIVAALRIHVAAWATWPASDQQYIPLLTTWLNQERWTGAPPETRNGNGAVHAGLTNAAGQPAPYGLTPGGRRMGPPAGAGEHPRSPYLGMAWMASRHGTIINRSRTTIRREPTEDEKRILNGADD